MNRTSGTKATRRLRTTVALATLWLAGAARGWAADEHTVALWLFDEPMYLNQAFYDASTNWYNLNLLPRLNPGSASWQTDHNATVVTGRFGNAIARRLSGGVAADTRLEMAFPYQSDWTWEFWLRATNAPSGTAYVFDTTTVRERCILESGGTSWHLVCRNTGLDAVVSAGSGLFDSAWHHIAFVYQGGGTTVTYFVDGTQRSQQAATVSNATSATAGSLTLLARYDGTSPLQASLDEFRISSVGRYSANFTPATLSRNFGSSPPTPSAPTGPAPLTARGVAELQGRKHLFIDGILFESGGDGLFLRAHPPSPSTYEVCMVATNGGSGPFVRDLPHERWEDGTVIWYDGVFLDYDGKVRFYYTREREFTGTKDSYWSMALSDDGLTFTRPNLGLVEFQGSTSNNILFHGRQGSVTLDSNPGADPWALFKFTGWEYNSGTVVGSSPDGIHWTRNEVQQTPFDTWGTVEHYWDDQTGTYRCFLRGESYWATAPSPQNGGTGREALLIETTNFFMPWPFQRIAQPSWRDNGNRWGPVPCGLELPKPFFTEYWPEAGFGAHTHRTVSHKYAGAPDVHLAMCQRYDNTTEIQQPALATSRDGRTWTNWKLPWYVQARQTFNGVAMQDFISINGLLHREGELWQYGALKKAIHMYSSPDDRLIRMKQRVDGFVSLSADAIAGEAITREIRFAGANLSLNVRVRSGGSVGIAILNADGSARAGYGLEDCDSIEGDFVRKAVTWNGAANIATSATVRLKIRLQNADLYALQFTNQVVQLTNLVAHEDGLSVPLQTGFPAAEPADRHVMAGVPAMFSVAALGTAPLYYQWYSNNVAIIGATGTSYRMPATLPNGPLPGTVTGWSADAAPSPGTSYTTPATTINDDGRTFKVVVSNAYGFASTSRVATLRVYATPPEAFVAPVGAGSHTEPYDTWAKAATNLAAAIAFAQANNSPYYVTVSNGTYNITNELAILTNITVRSFGNGVYGGLANAAATIVKGPGSGDVRIFNISSAGAVVDGFTIRDGYVSGTLSGGGGIKMSTGTISNCIIRNNRGRDLGGGIRATGGTVANCWILENTCNGWSGVAGGGINGAATVRNCLIAGNSASGSGGGVFLEGGSLENCTIVTNTAGAEGGGISRSGGYAGTVSNSIVYFNTAGNATYKNIYSTTDTGLGFNCTTNPTSSASGSISDDPLFVNPAQTNYTLQAASPCIDKGSNQTWMAGATDLAGNSRALDGDGNGSAIVDMGAYEAGAGGPQAPAITLPPTNLTVTAGQTAAFSVTASGTPPLFYQWYTNDAAIGGATASSYTTPPTTTNESGRQFTVTVTNAYGAVTSSVAVLTVNPIVTYTVSYEGNGENSGSAPASQTKTNGVALTLAANSGNLAKTGYTFAGWNTAADGSGTNYAEGASYTTDASITLYAKWTANMPPAITASPTNLTVTAGQTAAFSVTATGTAPLFYQWYTNNTPIGGATASSYTTPQTTTNDSGTQFKVTVTNAYGAVTSSVAVLTVNPAPTGGVSATGGTVTNYVENGTNFTAHIFTNTATTNLQVTVGGNVEVLIVAGGGGGAGGGGSDTRGGGGGAGGLIVTNVQVASGSNYTITVGGGGFGGPGSQNGGQGTNSVAFGFTAVGGGYGSNNRNVNGGNGGSGGGVGASINAGTALPGNPTAGQGYAGGTNESAKQNAGGGGGAGSAGQNGGTNSPTLGLGGSGKTNSFSGAPVEYARGGNGRRAAEGGGNGTNGTANTGNGGNGAGPNELGPGYSNIGGKGGSGIVIVRYVTGGSDPYQTWRAAYFTTEQLADANISGDTADPDHDGLNNQQEYWAGTNPTNVLSCLILYAATNNIATDGKFLVRWQSVPDKSYTVMATTNLLIAFTNLATNLPATPTLNVYTDSVSGVGCRFYRVKVE